MAGAPPRGQALLLAVLSTTALGVGFAATSAIDGPSYATLGTLHGEDAAYAIALSEGRTRFALEGQEGGKLSFALYDPLDSFFGGFDLDEDRQRVDVIVDRPGFWVVFVTLADGAELAVKRAEKDIAEELPPDVVLELPVREERRTIADQRGDALDAVVATRVDQRPAMLRLDVRGNAQDLDAAVSSPSGVAFRLRDVSANLTNGLVVERGGERTAWPEHLTTGTYRIEATAARLAGRLDLVLLSYDRSVLDEPGLNGVGALVGQERPGGPEGPLVASLEERRPVLVDTRDAHRLAFSSFEGTSARLFVYGEEHQMLAIVELGDEGAAYEWDWSGEDEPTNASEPERVTRELVLDRSSQVVLYLERIFGDAETVDVYAPGREQAPQALELEVVSRTITLGQGPLAPDGDDTADVVLEGGLLGIALRDWRMAGRSIDVSVAGPRGPVLEHTEELRVLGVRYTTDHEELPQHFTGGLFRAELDADGPGGQVTVVLLSYHA